MTQSVNPPVPSTASLTDPFGVFLSATARALPDYRRLVRGKGPRLEINAAERFVRAFLHRHLDQSGAILAGEGPGIVRRALAAPLLDGLAAVATALLALREGLWPEAEKLAERAYAADQHETFAQRLALAARERSPSLRLAVDDWLEDRFCPNPFTDAEIIGTREAYSCCAAWLPAPLGSADASDPAAWWRSDRATEVRRSILDGDFGHCSRLSCPRIATRSLPRRSEVTDPTLRRAIDSRGAEVAAAPDRLLLSYDVSCNLSCPSCRTARIALSRGDSAALDAFFDAQLAPLAATATRIKVTGSGDPFGGRHFRRVVRKITALSGPPRLQLHTNGVLLDQRAWTALGLEGRVRSVWVSVDATVPETYARLRREGDWSRLLANLSFLGARRAAGALGELRLDFVVQAENFRQMPDFVRLARSLGADGVHFLMLRNWGTFSPAEYQEKAVTQPSHLDHGALLDVLTDPILGARDVDLGNLAPLRQAALARGGAAGDPVPVLLILSCARTGSNYLFDALRGFPELMALYEVFNPAGVFGLNHYPRATWPELRPPEGGAYAGERDPRLIDRMRRDPARALGELRAIAAAAGHKALALKVFSDHLPLSELTAALLAAPGVLPVVLRRDLVSAYISLEKARAISQWLQADTTEIRIAPDPAACCEWVRRTADWYAALGATLARLGRTPLVLDYAAITSCEATALATRLRTGLATLGIPLDPASTPRITLARQDRTPDPFDRVANGPALREALDHAGLLPEALVPPGLGPLPSWLT